MESNPFNEFAYVDNRFGEYAYKGNHLRKSEVKEDSCRARKVSKYFPKVEHECKMEHPKRVVSPYFQNKCGRKDSDDVSEYSQKDELECKVEHQKRAVFPCFQNCSTKNIEDLYRFMYQSEKVSSLRKCVKKSEHEGTVEEDSSPLPPKISKDSRKRPKVEKPKPFLKADRCREAYKRKTLDNNWVPPPSGFKFPLLQECHFHDPWRVMVICMLLNRTQREQAIQVLDNFFELCPDAETCMQVTREEIEKVIMTLGLQVKRSASLQRLSREYSTETWTYAIELHGVGKFVAIHSEPSAEF